MMDSLVNNSGVIRTTGMSAQGGEIVLEGGGKTLNAGTLDASSNTGKGGTAQVLGQLVGVGGSGCSDIIDASGASGGGTILVGGDYQGKNPDVQNAQVTYFGPQALLKADATHNGDGGKVIVWADDTTRTFGAISARGGNQSGNGGLVETSAHHLETAGIRVNASAVHGRAGSWLLDPASILIDGVAYVGDIGSALNGGTSVELQTSLADGDIIMSTVTLAVTPANDASLTLKANRNIVISDSSISSSGHKLGVTLDAH